MNERVKQTGINFIDRPILLIGMTGCGKTTVGKELAENLGIPFLDTDWILSSDNADADAGKLFSTLGEARFREEEFGAFQKALSYGKCVIASGGGLPTYKKSFLLAKERCIPVLIYRTLTQAPVNPPVCADMQKYLSIMEERAPIYSSLALLSYENREVTLTAAQIAHDLAELYKK